MITTNHNGAVAVEFAIILPLLILVLFGIIEFGLLLFNQQIITNAAREGARAGIVARQERFEDGTPGDPSDLGDIVDVEAVVNNWLAEHLVTFGDTNDLQPDVEILDDGVSPPDFKQWNTIYPEGDRKTDFEDPLRVTVRYDYEFLVLSNLGFGPRTLVARSLMRME